MAQDGLERGALDLFMIRDRDDAVVLRMSHDDVFAGATHDPSQLFKGLLMSYAAGERKIGVAHTKVMRRISVSAQGR